jgi:hypothetical protein
VGRRGRRRRGVVRARRVTEDPDRYGDGIDVGPNARVTQKRLDEGRHRDRRARRRVEERMQPDGITKAEQPTLVRIPDEECEGTRKAVEGAVAETSIRVENRLRVVVCVLDSVAKPPAIGELAVEEDADRAGCRQHGGYPAGLGGRSAGRRHRG